MVQKELDKILELHKKWLNDEPDGVRADLAFADLTGADLARADLARADLAFADLTSANLTRANLTFANLTRANLTRANLDFSSLPLWCGSLKANFDDRQLTQIAYHLVKAGLQSNNASEKTKAELSKLINFANKFHRVSECGKIEALEKKGN